ARACRVPSPRVGKPTSRADYCPRVWTGRPRVPAISVLQIFQDSSDYSASKSWNFSFIFYNHLSLDAKVVFGVQNFQSWTPIIDFASRILVFRIFWTQN